MMLASLGNFVNHTLMHPIQWSMKYDIETAQLNSPTMSSDGTSASFKTVTIFFTSSTVPFCIDIKLKTLTYYSFNNLHIIQWWFLKLCPIDKKIGPPDYK